MKLRHLMFGLLGLFVSDAIAQKTMYIPQEWRNRTDTLIYAESDPNNQYTWSKSRSKETDNVIILWDKYYGNTNPSNAASTYKVDIDDLAEKTEAFYDLEINKLGFVDKDNSNLSKYKVMVLLNHTADWVCYGGGYDYQVPALWLSPSTCKPVGQSVAHEVGHSFHYMCYSEASEHGTLSNVQTGFHSGVGSGSVTWEQTAQWQSLQSYPELMYSQSHTVFKNSHNYAMTHEWQRYQSYWFFYYLCQKYNDIQTVAKVWNQPETSVVDFNQALMDLKQLSSDDLFKLYYDYASRLATWDLDVCEPYRDSYIGDFTYRCSLVGDSVYRVALASCPQSTGFNIIPLTVPEAGTEITVNFSALPTGYSLADSDPAEFLNGSSVYEKSGRTTYYKTAKALKRGFRLGYVALMNDGSRQYFNADSVYCKKNARKTEQVSMTLPEGVQKLWFVVVPAPTEYIQHKWDESMSGDDMWPYEFSVEGADLGSAATLYVSPTIDGRNIEDVTFTYDVYQEPKTDYTPTSVVVSGTALAKLGTALQLDPSEISGMMQSYSASGPSNGKIMFYAADANKSLVASGSTANGYGHWFDASGNVVAYSSGRLYSEFSASSMTFNIGQYPSRLSSGSNYTIRQALRYKKSATESAVAYFIFNVYVTKDKSGYELSGVEYDEEKATAISDIAADKADEPADVYDMTGRKVLSAVTVKQAMNRLPAGFYITGGKKFVVR